MRSPVARRAVALLPLLAVAALAAAPVEARPPGKDARRMVRKLEENATRLGLSAARLAEIRAVVDAEAPAADALDVQLRAAHEQMRELLSTPRPDEAAVMRQAEAIGRLETALMQQRLRTLLHIRPLLTDTQLAELKRIRQERIGPVQEACGAAIAAHCASARGREMVDCLRDRADLPPACQAALDALRRR